LKLKGYVQVYTGDGRGKTTAALGLVLRACGAGLRVYFGQFIKRDCNCSEIKALEKYLPSVVVEQYGRGCFIRGKPSAEDIKLAADGLSRLRAAMRSGRYDVVVADEANGAVSAGLFVVEDLISLIDDKPENVELIFTGRNAHEKLVARADLVTDMKKVKHYFDKGVKARSGMEC